MLITWMSKEEREKYNLEKYDDFEVVIAKQRRVKEDLGYIVFSREEKKVISSKLFTSKNKEMIMEKLNKVATRQIKPVSRSFHSMYPRYNARLDESNCPVCKNEPMPKGMEDIAELQYSYVTSEDKAQGKLYGKCVVVSKVHNVHFYDLSDEDMMHFMQDVKKAAKALHEVTKAVKINYEIHGNSSPHLHCHLFPRYLDDDFPGTSINYQLTTPSPYETKADYDYFFNEMRKKLQGMR